MLAPFNLVLFKYLLGLPRNTDSKRLSTLVVNINLGFMNSKYLYLSLKPPTSNLAFMYLSRSSFLERDKNVHSCGSCNVFGAVGNFSNSSLRKSSPIGRGRPCLSLASSEKPAPVKILIPSRRQRSNVLSLSIFILASIVSFFR